jgi:L-iditol 2-dehydrogenase
VRASRIGGRVVLAGIPDGDAYTLSTSEARRRGLKIKFPRRMGDDYSRAIGLVSSGSVNVRAMVTHREGMDGRPRYLRRCRSSIPTDTA